MEQTTCCNPRSLRWAELSSNTPQNSCSSVNYITTLSVNLASNIFCIFSFPSNTSPATVANCCSFPNNACQNHFKSHCKTERKIVKNTNTHSQITLWCKNVSLIFENWPILLWFTGKMEFLFPSGFLRHISLRVHLDINRIPKGKPSEQGSHHYGIWEGWMYFKKYICIYIKVNINILEL